MTDDQRQEPQPGAPDPQQPYTQQPYAQQPYAQQPYAQQSYAQQPYPSPYPQRPVRPPLTPAARRGVIIAGSVGFVLLSIGYGMIAVPLSILLFGALVSIVRSRGGQLPDGESFDPNVIPNVVVPQDWTLPLVLISIAGLLVMVAAILVSWRVLRAHAVSHPVGVTFAGAGIAIVGSLVAQGILSGFISTITSVSGSQGVLFGPTFWIAAAVGTLVTLAISAVIGWLSWWWMAHAMRPVAGA